MRDPRGVIVRTACLTMACVSVARPRGPRSEVQRAQVEVRSEVARLERHDERSRETRPSPGAATRERDVRRDVDLFIQLDSCHVCGVSVTHS